MAGSVTELDLVSFDPDGVVCTDSVFVSQVVPEIFSWTEMIRIRICTNLRIWMLKCLVLLSFRTKGKISLDYTQKKRFLSSFEWQPEIFLDNFIQGLPFFTQSIYPFFNLRIFDQWRCMMRLDPRINDQGAFTAPVLVFHKAARSINIMRRIAPCESCPEEIIQIFGNEIAVVAYDQ